jgi:small subunit ribosomal protein S16
MPVVIRLMRAGAKKRPFYRMVAADSRRQRDGRFLEILGHYNPIAKPYELVVHKDLVVAWLSKGRPAVRAVRLAAALAEHPAAPGEDSGRRQAGQAGGQEGGHRTAQAAPAVGAQGAQAGGQEGGGQEGGREVARIRCPGTAHGCGPPRGWRRCA